MALKLRYEELNEKKWNSKSPLSQLIRYFESRSYLEVFNDKYMNHVRNARNYLSHPEKYGFGGYMGLYWIDSTIDLINDLYEYPTLRKERFIAIQSNTQALERIVKEGAVLEGPGIRFLVQGMGILFIANKSTPNIYSFLFLPFFMIQTRIQFHH